MATYTLIESQVLGSTAPSVTFSAIPATYTDLKVVCSVRGTAAYINQSYGITFNGTSTTGFSEIRIYGDGSSAASGTAVNSIEGVGSLATANTFSNDEIYIPNYTSTSNYKSYSVENIGETNATLTYALLVAGLWSDTSAITSIVLTGISASFVQYSSFYLYGISNTI
jgi:hypothetical protein